MPVIAAENVRKEFGHIVAVDGLTLSVERGEVFGFLGPNGSGKTTTVKILLGLIRPTSGRARILGHRPGDSRVMGRLGFLPEHFRFPTWMTAFGFLDFNARLLGMSSGERGRRIPALLAGVGLAGREASRLGQFSKGMRQRIGLAQALLNDPEVVFLDEPTSGLDPLGRREVRDRIRNLRDSGVSVFLNSHLLGEVEAVCDRVAIVKRGRVIQMGRMEDLQARRCEVELRATGLSESLVEGLKRWGRVSAWKGDDLRLHVEDEASLPEVVEYMVAMGARLQKLSPRRLSLEDLFAEAIAGGPVVRDGVPAEGGS